MSQTKVQLIAPIGVVTASTLETTGVLTATTFVGDIAGTVTGITSTTDNLNLGIVTATSFAGDFTGIGSGLTGTPNVVAGVVTATKFVGNTPGLVSGIADGTNINAGIITATSFVGNLTGNAAGLSTTTGHANLGIVTATSFHGAASGLTGVSAGPVGQQAVTANSGTTAIDLSSGNVIYMTQSANTTVSFANTEGNTDVVYLIRVKDDNTTERTITWPSGMVWNGGTEPTLVNNAGDTGLEGQVFKLTTRDNGATWYGSEVVNYDTIQAYDLWAWGFNYNGYLGQNQSVAGTDTPYSSPVQIPGKWGKIPLTVSDTNTFMAAIRNNKTLWAWGRNQSGELGQNQPTNTSYSSPIQIGSDITWSELIIGDNQILAYKVDGTMWAWGDNEYGALGQNEHDAHRSSPVQIPGTTWDTSLGKSSCTGNGFGAIKTDGTLWVWGRNLHGVLGQNQAHNTGNVSSPVQIPGTTWSTFVGGGVIGALATKTDGTLWTWGRNYYGALGLNNITYYSSPTQIPGTTWTDKIYHGYAASSAIKTDGTLWAWGDGRSGQLGQNQGGWNDAVQYSSPVQIPGTTWANIAMSNNSMIGAKTDGTLWAWGHNSNGELGQNSNTRYSSPVQIPGTWPTTKGLLFGGNYNYFALKE